MPNEQDRTSPHVPGPDPDPARETTDATFPPEAASLLHDLNLTTATSGSSGTSTTGSGAPSASPVANVPPVVGYAILGELGRGGMGVVYQARQLSLNRLVALKMILAAGSHDSPAVARFLAEAEVVAAIRHLNVVQVYDYGESEGRPFMALEFLAGGTLADRLKDGKPLLAPEAAALVEKIARGIQAAHSRGIVHRDIKPGNILFDEAGEPKVSDFGLAKRAASDLTQSGAVMGTPAYMAPEQAGGRTKEVGPATDVWALGVILYECLTGSRPFVADRVDALLALVLLGDPNPLRSRASHIPRDLDTICRKCLEKEPSRRYPSALALAQDLERFQAGEPILARPEGTLRKVWRRVRRRGLTIGLIAALLVAVGIAGWLVVQSGSTRRVNELARQFDEGLDVADWPDGHRARLEVLTDHLAAVAPEQGEAARKRLLDRVVRRFRDVLARPRVDPAAVPALEVELAWITARDHDRGAELGKALNDRLRKWSPIFELAAPFTQVGEVFSPGLVTIAADRLTLAVPGAAVIPTRISSRRPFKAEVEFAPGWEAVTALGLVIHLPSAPGADALRGYTFRLVPSGQATRGEIGTAPAGTPAPTSFRTAGGARAEIAREGAVLRDRPVRPTSASLRLTAERIGSVLRFRVNDDDPPLDFEDAFPYAGDEGSVLGLVWPATVALTKLKAEVQPLPPAASPLERADDLFERGQFVEAAAFYQRAASDPSTAAEALYKTGMSFAQVKRRDEAVHLLESAAGQSGDRWPVLAACQLWVLLLDDGKFEEADVVLATAAARFTPDQLARNVPFATRARILALYNMPPLNYIAPEPNLVRRAEAAARIGKLLGDNQDEFSKRFGYMIALAISGQTVHARDISRELVPLTMERATLGAHSAEEFPWALRWYCWLHRQSGSAAQAAGSVATWLAEYPRRSPPDSPSWFKAAHMPLYLEQARFAADEGRWEEAEVALDTFLKESPRPINNYNHYVQAYMMKGFCRLNRNDPAGAAKIWAEGRYPAYKAQWPAGAGPAETIPPGRHGLVDHWILSSLTNTLSDAEGKELVTALVADAIQDPTISQIGNLVQISPAVLLGAWQSPRGGELARKMAFLQLPPIEHYRNMLRVLGYEKLRQDVCDGKPTAAQDEILWQAIVRFADLVFDNKLSKAQMFPLFLAWKGTIGSLGWGTVAPLLPPEARGPVAYSMGLRYLKLNKPGDARTLFRTAATDAPANSPLARLAGEELAKLDGKPMPKELPVAPPPREVGK